MDWTAYKYQKFIFHASRGRKSKIIAPADLVSREPLPHKTAFLSLPPHKAEGGQEALWGQFYQGTNPIHEDPHDLMTSQSPTS